MQLKSTFFCLLVLAALTVLIQPNPVVASDALLVNSAPVHRGGVTPGLDNIVMQRLDFQAESGTVDLIGIKLNQFGTANTTETVARVSFYRETNSVGGLQITGLNPDTEVDATPATFNGSETIFTFDEVQTIGADTTSYYIVYELTTDAEIGETIGTKLVDHSYLLVDPESTVEPFADLQSRELVIVAVPHGKPLNPTAFTNTNLCQICHSVHLAPDFQPVFNLEEPYRTRRILNQPYFEEPDIVNNNPHEVYNALCYTCHDGTGADSNIKAQYNSLEVDRPGHMTISESTQTAGYKAPPEGQTYEAGLQIPCMVCHDAHSSERENHKMMADALYEYAIDNGWIEPTPNGRIDGDNERCLVCHSSNIKGTVLGIDVPHGHRKSQDCGECHGTAHEFLSGTLEASMEASEGSISGVFMLATAIDNQEGDQLEQPLLELLTENGGGFGTQQAPVIREGDEFTITVTLKNTTTRQLWHVAASLSALPENVVIIDDDLTKEYGSLDSKKSKSRSWNLKAESAGSFTAKAIGEAWDHERDLPSRNRTSLTLEILPAE